MKKLMLTTLLVISLLFGGVASAVDIEGLAVEPATAAQSPDEYNQDPGSGGTLTCYSWLVWWETWVRLNFAPSLDGLYVCWYDGTWQWQNRIRPAQSWVWSSQLVSAGY